MTAALIYLVGPSGSGKDSLLNYARERLSQQTNIAFAHRYITRPAPAGGENHVALTEVEFAARQRARLFALDWQSHGLHYGIGIEINQWLGKGVSVVVNGSRGYLQEARERYPELVAIYIEVPEVILRQRLLARGRETPEQIEQRLLAVFAHPAPRRGEWVIRNDTSLESAGEQLVKLIQHIGGKTACA